MFEATAEETAPALTLQLPGVREAVTVRRDAYGVAHIQAQNTNDLFYAFGFMQAADRLWQMDGTRRSAQGRLAEIAGPDLVGLDRWFRTLGIPQVARAMEAQLDPEHRALLQAFADGVNAYTAQYPERNEMEFRFLKYEPEPWTVYDSLCVMRMVSWWLSGDYEREYYAFQLAQRLGEEKAEAVYPEVPARPTRQAMREHALPHGEPETVGLPETPLPLPLETGSNADNGTNIWVIGGSRTASGRPILANDPHLQLYAPSVWYEVHLQGGAFDVIGWSFPGLPLIAIGHNREVAWGASNYPADTQDLFIEEIHPEGGAYLEGLTDEHGTRGVSTWEPLVERIEQINVRDLQSGAIEPLEHRVQSTARGPIVHWAGAQQALALSWKGLEPSQEVSVFLDAMRASTAAEFQAIFEAYGSPTQNFYVFDRAGHIGSVHAGKIPIRGRGEAGAPKSALDPAARWQAATVPYAALGQELDPGLDYFINANNKPVECDWATGTRFTPPIRYRRIRELLVGRNDWTPELAAAMQADAVNLEALDLLAQIRRTLGESPAEGELALPEHWSRLLAWDGNQATDETLATLWNVFRVELARTLLLPIIGEGVWQSYQDQHDSQYLVLMDYFRSPTECRVASWLAGTAPGELVRQAWNATITRCQSEFGTDPAAWRWSAVHQLQFLHPSNAPVVRALGAGVTLPHSGGRFTINVGTFLPSQHWNVTHGVSMRYVAWLDEDGRIRSRGVLPPGNAAVPSSKHYKDQVDLFQAGRLRDMPFYEEELEGLRVVLQINP